MAVVLVSATWPLLASAIAPQWPSLEPSEREAPPGMGANDRGRSPWF
ncbi:MAG: hypothetical protein KME20_22815 [Kaiparowitsia implicata GSE-PSE-MK54-09C]|nr:hypothetical protein [Kaiparowitsia implicata GSE-PSE-MK54-09C]